MARRRKSNRGWIAGLSIVGVLAVITGAIAIASKGFKEWGLAERVITGGEVVMKLTADSFDEGEVIFTNGKEDEDEVALVAGIEGELKVDEEDKNKKTLILGDDDEAGNMSKADLEEAALKMGMSAANVEKLENQVLGLGYAKASGMVLSLDVETDEDEAAKDAIELPYFDAIRVNYKIPASRVILTADNYGDNNVCSYVKRINTITSLYENLDLFDPAKNETISNNYFTFVSYSIGNDKDNTVEIESIELIKTVKGHEKEKVWVTQQALGA